MSDYVMTPPILSNSSTPMVMLAMSNDHQLYYKAYTDYDDLDSDGTLDITYLHSFEYYGYFDSGKCYDYDSGDSRFEPKDNADADGYCTGSNSGYWSGNFLNWASMARIDTVRKILYGGYRSTDSASETVLERTYLPNDAHSFAKFYDGADVDDLTPFTTAQTPNGLTICNTTVNNSGAYSQNVTQAPLIRVASGNYALWAGNERWQCRWSNEKSASNGNVPANSGLAAASSNPSSSDHVINGDYTARIQVCSHEPQNDDNCKQYPDGNYKPTGLLQSYGDDDTILFGLMSGSYTKNKSGGVLRKNIGSMSDEINTTTDGTFKTAPAAGSIIGTLNEFTIYGYSHTHGYYNAGGGDNCSWGLNSFTDGRCTNWGNPVAEILSECYRYYAGESAAFHTDDSSRISGLTTATWADPLNTDNKCSNLNVIMLNASTISYDGDGLGTFDSDFGVNSQTLTKNIGDNEGITGGSYFVGENGVDNDQLCTAKTVTDLGLVEGTCPDAPRIDGSYKMAGMAHFAHTNDIRSATVGASDLEGEQTVTTYGVALSPALPSVVIDVPGSSQTVSILPACRNETHGANCAIVDFKIAVPTTEDPGNPGEFVGAMYVNWEDSEQGGDYDQDMWGTISYRINSSKIAITTDVIAKSTPFKLGFGYVVSGTTKDGFHVHSGINGMNYSDPVSGVLDCSNCQHGDAATTQEYSIGTSSAGILEQPLFYAAKWGGFDDLDSDGVPDDGEWDEINNTTGAADTSGDGLPDNYFLATSPSQLAASLSAVFENITSKTASGTNAAVVSNSSSGVGAIYQALYQPQENDGNKTVNWIGKLHALFIDEYGLLRADDGDAVLEDYNTDKIIRLVYDSAGPNGADTYYQTYDITFDADGFTTTREQDGDGNDLPSQPLGTLGTIWNAVDELEDVTDVVNQRIYSDPAVNGRYIFTAIDSDGNGTADNTEVLDFTYIAGDNSTLAINNGFRYLDVPVGDAEDLIKYIRGDDTVGGRNRTVDYDDDGDDDVMRLGDIVHSSPVVVAAPNDTYHLTHNDDTYREFVELYSKRRQMVYVGANDGMVHAFNAGFWNAETKAFLKKNDNETEHSLGSELWGYVPMNLLPHLQWLKRPDYEHVYYMDGSGFAQDVKIFDDDDTHPNGWGTILVMGMRFGGGAIGLDTDGDGTDDKTTGSAYVVLDITDPEQPPTLIAEITAPEFGFTTSKPAIVKERIPTVQNSKEDWNSGTNNWWLVFGSGPHGSSALSQGLSGQNARVMAVNLNQLYDNSKSSATNDNIYESGFSPTDDLGEAASFVGDMSVADWDRDLQDDAIYFGTASGTNANATGKLMRIGIESSVSTATLVDIGRPILSAPLTATDGSKARWVMAGTGKLFAKDDNFNSEQQYVFGVKEPQENDGSYDYNDSVNASELIDTTDIRVFSDGSVTNSSGGTVTIDGTVVETYDEVETVMKSEKGWKIRFEDAGTIPSGRSTSKGTLDPANKGLFAFTEYVPPAQICEINGTSYLWELSYETGTTTAFAPLGRNSAITNGTDLDGEDIEMSNQKVEIGPGQAGEVTFHQGEGLNAITNLSTGAIETTGIGVGEVETGRQSWRQIDTSSF